MSDSSVITPKATFTLSKLSSFSGGYTSTYQLNRGKFVNKLSVSDKTFQPLAVDDLKKLKDVTLTSDVKLDSAWTANTKYDFASQKYTVGATWNGKLGGKAATLKGTYPQGGLVSGEATVSLDKSQKANLTFNQKELLNAKYTLTKGSFTLEPSYNIVKKAPAVSVTKKVGKSDTLKLAYDIKSETAAIEYAHKPLKLVLGTTVSKSKLSVAKPTLSVVFENTYSV